MIIYVKFFLGVACLEVSKSAKVSRSYSRNAMTQWPRFFSDTVYSIIVNAQC